MSELNKEMKFLPAEGQLEMNIQATLPFSEFLGAVTTEASGIVGSDIDSSDWFMDGDDS